MCTQIYALLFTQKYIHTFQLLNKFFFFCLLLVLKYRYRNASQRVYVCFSMDGAQNIMFSSLSLCVYIESTLYRLCSSLLFRTCIYNTQMAGEYFCEWKNVITIDISVVKETLNKLEALFLSRSRLVRHIQPKKNKRIIINKYTSK